MAKRQLHKRSAREAESIVESGRYGDGGGLYLVIEAGAHWRRQWIFLYRARGTKGKGKDGLSLTDARLKAADARKKLAEGHRGPSGARSMHKPAGGR